jgi:hypothetical protein
MTTALQLPVEFVEHEIAKVDLLAESPRRSG